MQNKNIGKEWSKLKEVKGYEDAIKLIKNVSKEVLSKKEEDYIQKQTVAALSIFDGLYRSRITLAGFNEFINTWLHSCFDSLQVI